MPANGSEIREAIVPADVRASSGAAGLKFRCDGNLGTSSPDELKQWPLECQVYGEADRQTCNNKQHKAGQDEKKEWVNHRMRSHESTIDLVRHDVVDEDEETCGSAQGRQVVQPPRFSTGHLLMPSDGLERQFRGP